MNSPETKGSSSTADTTTHAPDFKPSTDIWYGDGSIVLVAESTAFRVHSTILADHCGVFKDMMAIPQPKPDSAAAEDVYEGCEVMRMHDSPADLKHFLKSIYSYRYFQPGIKTKFPVVAAVLRLSTKYDAPDFRQRAIDFLVSAYPTTVEEWDERSLRRLIPPFKDEAAAYIALAVETDVYSILPAVYFAISRLPLAQHLSLLRGLSVSANAQWDITTSSVLGRERLSQSEAKHILGFLSPAFSRPGCQNSANCTNLLTNAARTALQKFVDDEPWSQWCELHAGEVGRSLDLCANCCTTVEISIRTARAEIWNQLPGLFGLSDRETLKANDDFGTDDAISGHGPA